MTLKILSLLCILGAIGLFGYEYLYPKVSVDVSTKSNAKLNSGDKINYRLQATEQKIKMQKLRALEAQDNESITETINEEQRYHKVKMIKGIDDRLDSTLQDVISDLTPRNKEESLQKLEDEIQVGVDALEDLEDYNEYEREAFIKTFIDNAKARGLIIKIDKDLNVYQ